MNRQAKEPSAAETKREAPQAPRQEKKAVEAQVTGEMLEEANSRVALNVLGRFVASRL